jgi:hypothetical protein
MGRALRINNKYPISVSDKVGIEASYYTWMRQLNCHSEANAEESAFSLPFFGFRFFRAFAIYVKADFSLRSK